MSPAPRVIPDFPYADLLDQGPFNDWRDDLKRDGYAIVRGAIPLERALAYRDKALGWLEAYGGGYNRNDPSTFGPAFLPSMYRGGMFFAYGLAQEQFVWDIRTEPGVKGAFALLWGTDKLVSSMDGGSIMIPGNGKAGSWPHIDLSPSRKGFFVAQGLVNLNHNGPEDGGLIVMKGSSALVKDFFDEHGRPPVLEGKIDWHMFTEEDKEWFIARGCEWIKVCAEPGDLIMWDSATIHQNCPPTGDRDRIVFYVCQGPAELVTDEDREVRQKAFKGRHSTSHAPFHGAHGVDPIPIRQETGEVDPKAHWRNQPVKPTEEVLRLASMLPY